VVVEGEGSTVVGEGRKEEEEEEKCQEKNSLMPSKSDFHKE